jgi:hypothetical protein
MSNGSSLALRNGTDIAGELPAIFQLASALVKAGGFLPTHLRGEGEIVAVVLAGRELGIGPMASIRSIKIVKGNVTLDAALQLGLMIRAGLKYRWLNDGSDGQTASLELSRDGQEPYVSTFTLAFAERAGLLKDGGNWKMYPQAMLRARAISAAGKAYCPDILAGIYLPDELDDEQQSYEPPRFIDAPLNAMEPSSAAPALAAGPSKDESLAKLINDDLPGCSKIEHFAETAREIVRLHGPVRKSKAWLAFQEACAAHEVSPREAINLAMQPAEAAQ